MKRPSLVALSLSIAGYSLSSALAWNAASDEKRRQMTINQMNQNASAASQRASQPPTSGGRYTPSSPSSSSSGSSSRSSSSSPGESYNSFAESVGEHERGATSVTTHTVTRRETPEQLNARIRAGAERGDRFMQWTLGRMYNSGVGVARNTTEAVKWFRTAAEAGDADGQCSLADMLYAGDGVPKDQTAAVGWYVKAARQGHGVAAKNAGVAYQNGWGVPASDQKAREFYQISADTREPEAALWLAGMYRDGAGGPKDLAKACPLFKIAAEQGLLLAMNEYGTACFNSDMPTGAKWIRKAADGGLPRGKYVLGMLLINGLGVPKDPAAGAKLVIESAPAVEGDTKPLMMAGTALFNGIGVKKNVVEGLRYYRMAAERKDPNGTQAIGEVRQKVQAGGWGQEEARQGFALLAGRGVPKDEVKGCQLLKVAAEAGNLNAMGGVGNCYKNGTGTKADPALAAYYLHTAALLGLTPAMWDYGVMRCNGAGAVKDEADGVKWIKEAAANGDENAHAILGEIYEKGECGVTKDLVKARAEYQIAATGGDEESKKALQRLGK